MSFAGVWRDVVEACESKKDEVTLLTPSSRRRFTIEAVHDDRIDVAFPDEADERGLPRERFESLADRLETAPLGLDLSDLPPRVEPYATVLSLTPGFVLDEDGTVLSAVGDAKAASTAAEANPFVREGRPEPTPPERVHGDLVLLADLLERLETDDPGSLSTEQLADLYVMLSEVQRGADEYRRAASDELRSRLGPDGRFHGRYGTVHRTVRERRYPKPDDAVFAVLDAAGIPREWVLGVDPEKLDVVVAATDVDEVEVFDLVEQVYIQKTDVEAGEKRARLQGIRDRLARIDTAEADELFDEVEAIEARLDDLLATS